MTRQKCAKMKKMGSRFEGRWGPWAKWRWAADSCGGGGRQWLRWSATKSKEGERWGRQAAADSSTDDRWGRWKKSLPFYYIIKGGCLEWLKCILAFFFINKKRPVVDEKFKNWLKSRSDGWAWLNCNDLTNFSPWSQEILNCILKDKYAKRRDYMTKNLKNKM